ncbi:hypothetical protein AHAS_Ahas20G0102600 [Arachis hypogaea]
MELLARASMEGSVEAGYLLPCCYIVITKTKMKKKCKEVLNVERCREFFTEIFWERWIDERPSDPGHAVACQSTTCTTRGTMADVNDVSRVSCVHCLANYELANGHLMLFQLRAQLLLQLANFLQLILPCLHPDLGVYPLKNISFLQRVSIRSAWSVRDSCDIFSDEDDEV